MTSTDNVVLISREAKPTKRLYGTMSPPVSLITLLRLRFIAFHGTSTNTVITTKYTACIMGCTYGISRQPFLSHPIKNSNSMRKVHMAPNNT